MGATMGLNIDTRVKNSLTRIQAQIDKSTEEAMTYLDDLTRLMQLKSDFEWLRGYVKAQFPLGVGTTSDRALVWLEEKWVYDIAEEHGLSALAQSVIDDLNGDPWAPSFVPSRAAIALRNDEAHMIAVGAP
jgi:hypothetical protein